MKIKRFFATDIRQAMRMVKDELGPDAVIMSNRAVEGGIEILAAQDFDEQLLHKKLQEQAAATAAKQEAAASEAKSKKISVPIFEETKKRFQALDGAKKEAAKAKVEAPAPVPPRTQAKPEAKSEPVPVAAKPTQVAVPAQEAKKIILPNFAAAKKRLELENTKRELESAKKRAESSEAQQTRKFTSPYVGYAEKAQLVKAQNAPAHSAETKLEAAINPVGTKQEFLTNPLLNGDFSKPGNQAGMAPSTDALLLEMSRELKELRATMDTKLATIGWAYQPQSTPFRNDLVQRLAGMGISKKLTAMMANNLAGQLAGQQDVELAFSNAQDMLAGALPIADDNLLDSGGIIALVGPTGVGKTTTIAKLAAKFILQHGASQVALVTTDNYRIGAHEQLNTYGRILNIPVRVASCADDLCSIIHGFANKRLVLIDTAGMCQRDMNLVEQINTLQQNNLPIKSYLVMSAATEYKTMNSVIKAFSVFAPQAAILTKLDEAIMTGPAISSIIEHNLPLAFITDGQQVPEDFHHPDARALIRQCALEADTELAEDEADYQPWGAQAYA